MQIQSLKLVYFSPTGTTKTIIQSIGYGINHNSVEMIDITLPSERKYSLQTSENDLLIVGVPVYMGRVPVLLSEWLHSIKAQNTLAVCVVVYGNRAYENALLELNDILKKSGCIPIAGAACIGEHSFSSPELPSSEGRPDANDIRYAELFGRKIAEKLLLGSSARTISDLYIPGTYPYGGVTELWEVDFIAVSQACMQCGVCAENCPAGAVNCKNSQLIDLKKCTLCCACIKHCSQKAKTMKPGLMKDAAIRTHKKFNERKDPEFFL